jgi:hypothetical protein
MHYKTIVLGLIEERPEIHEKLRRTRTLLPTLELYAKKLKTSHEAWKEHLFKERPASDPSQIASEALEIALSACARTRCCRRIMGYENPAL